jgi:hypothetical protein
VTYTSPCTRSAISVSLAVSEEELERFLQVVAGFLNRVALAGDVDLGTKRHEAIAFALDECG